MAARYRSTIVVIELGPDGIKELLGRGVRTVINKGVPTIEADIGAGMVFYSNRICPKLGAGLHIDGEEIAVNHCELACDLAGNGLKVEDCKLVIDTSCLQCDTTPDPCQTTTQTSLTDSKLTIEGHNLVLKKTYTTFNLLRNAAGVLLDIQEASVEEKTDSVAIPDGYGYLPLSGTPVRESTMAKPNFYKK